MMTDIKEHSIKRIVVGYTLDSVIEAHNQAQNVENEVVFYNTGTLGEPLDKYNDFISYDDAKRLSVILPDLEFDEFHGCDYLYIPYEKLKFKNSHNGLITLPFNKLSFDDIEEWKAVRDGYLDEHVQAILKDMSNSPTRLITMFKQYLPKWFVDSIIRNVSNTRWADIPTSNVTLNGYLYEFNLNQIESEGINMWYKPRISYNEICKRILKKDKIPVYAATKEDCVRFLTDRSIEYVTFMDNRVDHYLGYRSGIFDRCVMSAVRCELPSIFANDFDNGIIRTPTLAHWGICKYGNDVRKLYSKKLMSIIDVPTSDIPMTKNNLRIYDAYSKLLPLFGNFKTLNLQQKITTLIK